MGQGGVFEIYSVEDTVGQRRGVSSRAGVCRMGVQMSWGIPKEWKTGLGQHCWRGSGALMEVGCIGSKGASEIYRAECLEAVSGGSWGAATIRRGRTVGDVRSSRV